MEEKEKRAATRIEVPLAGKMTFDAKGEGLITIEVGVKDISVAGAYLWASAPKAYPRVGDNVGMNLRSPSDLEEFQLSVEAIGTVVRVDPPQGSEHGFAVKFTKIPDSRTG